MAFKLAALQQQVCIYKDYKINLLVWVQAVMDFFLLGVHDASSRSHAVLKVFFNASRSPTNRGRENDMMSNIGAAGTLTLIDLAGD
jgi:hypothetical protein